MKIRLRRLYLAVLISSLIRKRNRTHELTVIINSLQRASILSAVSNFIGSQIASGQIMPMVYPPFDKGGMGGFSYKPFDTVCQTEYMNIYLKLHRKDLVRLQFLLEGYERMSSITTIDPREARVRIMIIPDFDEDFEIILAELKNSVDFQIIQS